MRYWKVSVFFALLCLAACEENKETPPAGSEGGPCYSNGTCDEGLTCASDLCVDLNETNDIDTVQTEITSDQESDIYDSSTNDEITSDVEQIDDQTDIEETDEAGDIFQSDNEVPDIDSDSSMNCSSDICSDKKTGLAWQRSHAANDMTQDEAILYCDGLTLAGKGDWRLPTISDLRSIIEGCVATEIGGACTVSDPDCLLYSCYESDCESTSCLSGDGPGENGYYWESGIWGQSTDGFGYFWSSSTRPDSATDGWFVRFGSANVETHNKTDLYHVRCVRN